MVTAKAEPLTYPIGEILMDALQESGYWDSWTKVPTRMPKDGFTVGDLVVLTETRSELIFTLGNLATEAQRGAKNKVVRDKVSRRIHAITALIDKHDALVESRRK